MFKDIYELTYLSNEKKIDVGFTKLKPDQSLHIDLSTQTISNESAISGLNYTNNTLYFPAGAKWSGGS